MMLKCISNFVIKKKPRISVVTVVKNDVESIEKTIISVLDQTYNNFEYIVIDGASTDGTLEILLGFGASINLVISEPDNGVYSAMNKAAQHFSGDFIIYMNSGDSFFNSNVLKDFVDAAVDLDSIYYGSVYLTGVGGGRVKKPDSLKSFKNSRFSHQAAFIPFNISKMYPYSEKFKYVSDYKFFKKCFDSGINFIELNLIVSNYKMEGISQNNLFRLYKELFLSSDKKSVDFVYYFFELFKHVIFRQIRAWMSKVGVYSE